MTQTRTQEKSPTVEAKQLAKKRDDKLPAIPVVKPKFKNVNEASFFVVLLKIIFLKVLLIYHFIFRMTLFSNCFIYFIFKVGI